MWLLFKLCICCTGRSKGESKEFCSSYAEFEVFLDYRGEKNWARRL